MIDRSIDYLIGDVLSVLNRVTPERIGYFEGSQGLFLRDGQEEWGGEGGGWTRMGMRMGGGGVEGGNKLTADGYF